MNIKIVYSYHAKRRMKQRGITELEVRYIFEHPFYVKKSFEGTKEIVGEVKNRMIKIKFVKIENYIRIITVI